ncbi:hypothetical protein BDW68DRAFT_14207 [Aspergillus falconensis]
MYEEPLICIEAYALLEDNRSKTNGRKSAVWEVPLIRILTDPRKLGCQISDQASVEDRSSEHGYSVGRVSSNRQFPRKPTDPAPARRQPPSPLLDSSKEFPSCDAYHNLGTPNSPSGAQDRSKPTRKSPISHRAHCDRARPTLLSPRQATGAGSGSSFTPLHLITAILFFICGTTSSTTACVQATLMDFSSGRVLPLRHFPRYVFLRPLIPSVTIP